MKKKHDNEKITDDKEIYDNNIDKTSNNEVDNNINETTLALKISTSTLATSTKRSATSTKLDNLSDEECNVNIDNLSEEELSGAHATPPSCRAPGWVLVTPPSRLFSVSGVSRLNPPAPPKGPVAPSAGPPRSNHLGSREGVCCSTATREGCRGQFGPLKPCRWSSYTCGCRATR